jgi:uncharacterized membrane protein YphA (DoxX/SURF4 family)
MANIDRDRILKWLGWLPALHAAHIMLWYEQFKLTGAEGSVMLFNTLADWLWISGYEKPFRLSVAIAELVAAILLIIPRTRLLGALLTLGIMSGAIFFHVVSPLGIDPYHDGGALFKEACWSWLSAAVLLAIYRRELASLLGGLTTRAMRLAI